MLYKNLHSADRYFRISLKLGMDFFAALVFLLSGKSKDASAVMNAVLDFFEHKQEWAKLRKQFRLVHSRVQVRLVYPGIVVVERYLLGRKKFEQINF